MQAEAMTLDFGDADEEKGGFRLKITALRGADVIAISLHWNDKNDPTHVWTMKMEEIQPALNVAVDKTGEM